MKLIRVHVISADTCGGLLDGLDLWVRGAAGGADNFDPICLIGPNGAGKSQFLQIVAEIFQALFHAVSKDEEREEGNATLQFEVEYSLVPAGRDGRIHVRASRKVLSKKRVLTIETKSDDGWIEHDIHAPATIELLPSKIVGYTSGDNETLSLPFLISRNAYASEVGSRALTESIEDRKKLIPDSRLMLIDYGTHLEVLVANLLLGDAKQRKALLNHARLNELHSFRCVVQLNHSAAPKAGNKSHTTRKRKGIQLTEELETYVDQLQRCSTCYQYDPVSETYIFDFLVNDQSKIAFSYFWKSSLRLYSALHKIAMLNDLAMSGSTRDRFKREVKQRRFASLLPEPQDEDKVFRFERVNFVSNKGKEIVDYVSLSDGEHQLTQLLGTFAMLSFENVLFLLDEPESHFNPLWRVKFISNLLDLPGPGGTRKSNSAAAAQDVIMTTHSPFVPSDMKRENVLIFKKNTEGIPVGVRRPNIETYGATFDAILEECFNVSPPISELPKQEISELMKSKDVAHIKQAMSHLGHSVEKTFLADHVRQLLKGEK